MSKEAKILTFILLVIVGGMVALFSISGGGSGDFAETPAVDTSKLTNDKSHKQGSGSVSVVEFGDFQCPACASAFPQLKLLKAQYGDKITFTFRNYPLPMHKNANTAALTAEAAGSQNKFFEMHDELYEHQKDWEGLADPKDRFTDYAREIGIDADKFRSDLENRTFQDLIDADKKDGEDVGVASTPSIYVNGHLATSYNLNDLKKMVDEELEKQ